MPPAPQQRRWVFTLNNYTAVEVAAIVSAANQVKYLIFGRETGASGTPHLQGFVVLHTAMTMTALKAVFGTNRLYLAVARGNTVQCMNYCKKDNDFEEFGTPPLDQGKRNDWVRYVDWIKELEHVPTGRELAESFPMLYVKHKGRCLELAADLLPHVRLTESVPRPGWQADLAARMAGDPDPRKIDFIVDDVGNSGKSWMCQYALTTHPDKCQVLCLGKRDDLAHAIKPDCSIFMIDIPRGNMQYLQYSVLEMLKNRLVFSPKYNSQMKILGTVPYVVVFSNEQPERSALSRDRFNIINIIQARAP